MGVLYLLKWEVIYLKFKWGFNRTLSTYTVTPLNIGLNIPIRLTPSCNDYDFITDCQSDGPCLHKNLASTVDHRWVSHPSNHTDGEFLYSTILAKRFQHPSILGCLAVPYFLPLKTRPSLCHSQGVLKFATHISLLLSCSSTSSEIKQRKNWHCLINEWP